MHTITLIFLFIIVLIILIISLVKASEASSNLPSTKDANLLTAGWYLAWTVSILWIIIIGIVIGVICLFVFGPEFLPTFGKTLTYLILFVMVAAVVVVAVMSSISAYYIGISVDEAAAKTSYSDAVTSALVSSLSIGVFIVAYGITWYSSKSAAVQQGYDSYFQQRYPEQYPPQQQQYPPQQQYPQQQYSPQQQQYSPQQQYPQQKVPIVNPVVTNSIPNSPTRTVYTRAPQPLPRRTSIPK